MLEAFALALTIEVGATPALKASIITTPASATENLALRCPYF